MVIYTRLFIGNFNGLALYPFIFIHPEKQGEYTLNHELIHIEQQKELWLIGFAILYLYFNITRGYWDNPFEQEARAFEGQDGYLKEGLRQKFDWKYYV